MYIWDKPSPQINWLHCEVIDMGATLEKCGLCGKEEIRYVHVVQHPTTDEIKRVGRICAEKLCGDSETPHTVESKVKNRIARRVKWLTRNWKIARNGDHKLKLDRYHLVVYQTYEKWKYSIDFKHSKEPFETIEQAKLALFDDISRLLNK